MDNLITLIDWTIFILFTGFALGLGFGGAWKLWGLGKVQVTINEPKEAWLHIVDKRRGVEEKKDGD